ncbi:MAG: HYR domain-containing protein [Winogradskyella sp.]|uniref:HYR domain-containing protein n=1 Tax=Winogradskyella sp. TaxID=1883156 RepID=UPI000F3BD926|nr:HYR domain-containing protein [Winogradskyella sp.]RNC85008.1 MAG: HYR domain-containing protein [Winogradskyella sp.]
MKINTPLVLVFILFSLWQTPTKAQCDSTNDIIQSVGPSFYAMNSSRPDNVGQTFTPSCSSTIEGVSFWTDGVLGGTIGGVSVTAELWRFPSLNSRTLIASETRDIPFNLSNDDIEQYFAFDDAPTLNAGTEYGIVFTNNETDKIIEVLVNTNDVFTNGKMIRDFSSVSISGWDLEFRVYYEDNVAPNANCRNITRTLGADGTVSISANNINNNSTDADSGIVSFSISQSNFDCSDIGDNIVTLTVGDQNSNFNSCQATVTILDGSAPELTCPGDMTVFTDPGIPAVVNYDDILYNDCTVETPTGFDSLGVWNGKSYFLSQTALVPSQAYSNAESIGGYLATIEDAAHNEFIRSTAAALGETGFLFGYSDVDVEDSFVWHDPDATSTYTNWATIEPNDAGSGEDYTQMNGGGKWNDINNNTPRKYVIELSQSTITQTTGLASGSVFPLGTTTNTFEATDAFGNVGSCEFEVTVVENPFETSVELSGGKLTITDIENDSDDQITLSSDGTTLTIGDLVVPTVSGPGVVKTDPTTVTVPISNITDGFEFIGGNGTNSISVDSDLNITGDFDIKNINTFTQNGAITTTGAFKVSESIALDLTVRRALTAGSLDISGINSLNDQFPGFPITITGTTIIQTNENVDVSLGATAPHTFGGSVSISASSIFLASSQSVNLGTITATDIDDSIRNEIFVGSGDLTLTADVITAGDSDLYLRAENTINKPTGTITTDKLFFDGSDNGDTVALFFGDNDINMIEVESGRTMGLIVFNDIDDMEIGLLNIGDASLFAPIMNLTENTNIIKNGTGSLSIGTDTSTINITNPITNSVANIEHNAGTVEFFGSTITIEKLDYTGVSGTRTRFLDANTTFNDLDLSLEFGTLIIQAPVNIGSSGITIEVVDELLLDRSNSVLSGSGTFTGTSTTVEQEGTIAPGNGITPSILTVRSIEFNDGVFAPFIDSDVAFDQLNVIGTVTLTDADFAPTGDFSIDSGTEEIILINNDGNDAVVGTFNGLVEGAQVTLPGTSDIFIISYAGGNGNDVTLSRDSQAPILTCPQDLTIDCADAATVFALGVSTDTPIDIPDNDGTGITSIANITGLDADLEVTNITVQTAINHTWTGDLSIELIAPGGETVTLFAESLNEASDLNADFPITFTDSATTRANDIGATVGNSEAACQVDNICEYTAMGGVDAFEQLIAEINANGNSFNGDWSLTVLDLANNDTGNLVSWQINITAIDPDAIAGSVNTDPSVTGTAVATDSCNTPDCNVTISYEDSVVDGCGISEVITRTWTAVDASGNSSSCIQTITVTDTVAPILDTCPEDILFELAPGETEAIVTYDLPTATDVCGDVTITQTEGFASGELFPEGDTINTFSITDACGNETICSFTVTVSLPETLVEFIGGKLTITDINGGISDDDLFLSNFASPVLTISNLTAPVQVSGDVTVIDETTVSVPYADITNGMEFIAGDGINKVTMSEVFIFTGDDNDLKFDNLQAFNVIGFINTEADLEITGNGNLNLDIGPWTVENFSVNNASNITDRPGPGITVTGATNFSASNEIVINGGEGFHEFNGPVTLEADRITFTAGADLTFNEVNIRATDALQNFLVASPGTITLNGNINVTERNTNLFIGSNNGITQQSGIINECFLILQGTGLATATLNGANTVGAITAINPINADESAFTNLSFTNATNTFLEQIIVDEFTLTAPQFDLEPDFTVITKNGTGVSSFNADIDINNGTGTAIFNHSAGTINFNGDTNDFNGQVTYNGAAGTITNLNSQFSDFPLGGGDRSFTFGTLNGTGTVDAGDIPITVLDAANFSGVSTLVTGFPFVQGAITTISDNATLTPGGGTTGLNYTFDDLVMDTGATFAPRIVGDGGFANSEFDRLTVNGNITLNNANLTPTGGYIIEPDDEIIIIDNNGPNAVSGTFNNLPENSGVVFGDFVGMISYTGGDGNDVVLIPDTIDPVAVCQDLNLTVGVNGITVIGSQIDGGSSDNGPITAFLINGQPSVNFTTSDVGDNIVTLTVVDANGNTAECNTTINLVSNINATLPILISEYQPVFGIDEPQTIEIKGEPGESFSGVFVIIDGDNSRNGRGVVTDVNTISGDFNADGILTAIVPNLTNPTHTAVLTNSFTGTIDVTDIDDDNDGIADDLSAFGTIFDAVGVSDGGACCPLDVLYGTDFGGVDLPSIGAIPSAIFREGSVGDFYLISNFDGSIYDNSGVDVDASSFDMTPTDVGTFGSINPSTVVVLDVKVYLQGAALGSSNTLMRDDLRVAGLLPTTSPFEDGLTATFPNGEPNNTIVDWVWVELRDETDNTLVVDGQSALLQRDGDVVKADGTDGLNFAIPSDDYYVVVKHRNHLGIMSAAPITLSSSPTTADFTDAANPITFGTEAQTTIGMPAGVLGMWAGDADGDGEVSFTNDGNIILFDVLFDPSNASFSSLFTGANDYYDGDTDLNANASFQDDLNNLLFNVLFHPSNSSFSSLFTFTEQLPTGGTTRVTDTFILERRAYIEQQLIELQKLIDNNN